MARKDELVNSAVDAFEESTGTVPNDYEMSIISIAAGEMVDEENSD